jgi:hypothetical protein
LSAAALESPGHEVRLKAPAAPVAWSELESAALLSAMSDVAVR